MKRYFLICILLVAWISSNATVRYVSMLGNDSNNGLAWSTAKRNINGAMNDAAQGDTVFVAIGTYPQFSAKNGVHVFGGFLGTEQNLAERQAMHHGYLQDSSCTRIFTADQSANFLTSSIRVSTMSKMPPHLPSSTAWWLRLTTSILIRPF